MSQEQEQIWIIKADGTPTFVYDFDMQEGDRLATPEEIDVLINGPVPTLDEARTTKLNEINTGYDTVMNYIQAGYPDKEVLSWDIQIAQALALQTNPDASAYFVRALASIKGTTPAEMARRIIENSESWQPVAAMLTAQRQLMEEAAEIADTVEKVQAIQVSYTA